MISIRLPIKTISEANARGHWAAKARRTKAQRHAAKVLVLKALARRRPQLPLVVTLCRLSTRRLDSDNCAASMKAVQDGIADALGIDDGDAGITWIYTQRGGTPVGHVEVTIAPADQLASA